MCTDVERKIDRASPNYDKLHKFGWLIEDKSNRSKPLWTLRVKENVVEGIVTYKGKCCMNLSSCPRVKWLLSLQTLDWHHLSPWREFCPKKYPKTWDEGLGFHMFGGKVHFAHIWTGGATENGQVYGFKMVKEHVMQNLYGNPQKNVVHRMIRRYKEDFFFCFLQWGGAKHVIHV